MPHKYLLNEFEDYARSAAKAENLMGYVAERIHRHIPRYNWVGFYLMNPRDSGMLMLGPYSGSFTPNPSIALNQGLCGAAATTGRVIVADDVAADSRYLQTSDLVKSQISSPVMVFHKIVAVFNVESYFAASFQAAQERNFVESCTRIIGKCCERIAAAKYVNA
jgi:GAF domain-containing protein